MIRKKMIASSRGTILQSRARAGDSGRRESQHYAQWLEPRGHRWTTAEILYFGHAPLPGIPSPNPSNYPS
jgi:hypothetical protein